ncbi:MAG TPA: hypothetical protein VFM51_01025 [Solirubrobacterales bacterium]|nr:hypothetical protein [Solirubrobacterales bacterium]
MRNMKILGLCLVAALAAMAMIGAGSASATKLCESNTAPCPAGETYGKGTSIKAQLVAGTSSTMSSGFVTIQCTSSSMSGKTTSAGGGAGVPVTGEITSVTWKNCTSGLGACTASALFTPWSAEVTGTGGSGTMSVSNAGGKFTCGGVTCEYKASKASVSVTGGSPAIIKASGVSFSKVGGGFLCSSTATWTSEYEATSPNPLFIVSS